MGLLHSLFESVKLTVNDISDKLNDSESLKGLVRHNENLSMPAYNKVVLAAMKEPDHAIRNQHVYHLLNSPHVADIHLTALVKGIHTGNTEHEYDERLEKRLLIKAKHPKWIQRLIDKEKNKG